MADYEVLKPIKDDVVPYGNNFVSLGRGLLRWLRVWAVNADFSGVVTVSRTPVDGTDAANKTYVDTQFNPTIADIREVDGAPIITNPDQLAFDQADGFVVTNPAGSNARVDLAAIPNATLANSSVTVTAGTGLTGGGVVALGTAVTLNVGTIAVANGGTGLTGGTDGGIPAYTAAATIASSALLTNRALVVGGGIGATPRTIAAATNGQLPLGSTGADPVPALPTGGGGLVVTGGAGTLTLTHHVTHLRPVAATFPITNFPQLVKNSDTNWTAYTLDYDQTTSEEAFWFDAIPTGLVFTGATCEIWYRTSVIAGTIQWDIETLTRADTEAWDTNGTIDTSAADTVPGVAQQVGYVSTALTTTGWAAGEVLLVRVARNIADTAAADVKLIHALIRLT